MHVNRNLSYIYICFTSLLIKTKLKKNSIKKNKNMMIMMLTIIKTKLKKNSKQNNNNNDDNDANDNNTVCVLNKPTIYNLLVRFKQRF